MQKSFDKITKGYTSFRDKYVEGDASIMQSLSQNGQKPEIMIVACCDSRVDPAVVLQCDPGDLFVVRNVANIVPPYEKDDSHHGTSAALEFGICYLGVKHLILLGHSQCGGIQALLDSSKLHQDDFISNWVNLMHPENLQTTHNDGDCTDEYAKLALEQSHENCLNFPWIRQRVEEGTLKVHRWFFDIESGQIHQYSEEEKKYKTL